MLKRLFGFTRSNIVTVLSAAILLSTITGLEAAENTIKISGTGGAIAVIKEMAAAFRKKNPHVNILVITPPLGSRGGIRAVIEGSLDIGLSNRDLLDEEKNKDVRVIEYGKSPLVFVTRADNPLSDITVKMVEDIYTGRLVNWQDGSPIRLVVRPATDMHSIELKGLSLGMKKAVENVLSRKGVTMAATDDENADLLEKLQGSFGVSAYAQVIAEKRNLKILSLNGVKPVPETIANNTYPLINISYLVIKTKPLLIVKQFTDFVLSKEGQTILRRLGYLVKG
ncbi:MAG: phosphate transport system substrate-binding protein [Nitrospirae bacterium]|nr:MAG: phosphate transport system substrate-binding protein [Nitrospirota bacterium]